MTFSVLPDRFLFEANLGSTCQLTSIVGHFWPMRVPVCLNLAKNKSGDMYTAAAFSAYMKTLLAAEILRPSLTGAAEILRSSLTGATEILWPSLTGAAEILQSSPASATEILRPSLTGAAEILRSSSTSATEILWPSLTGATEMNFFH
ncbi:T-cell acute lymphocytic leukemia protein 1 [Acropora cervicornis]|uniref:T-cell acute lymphocytic leukemia protein 1 n=1 Tax=Acropora cervicornis TaxID=6130 RepID=A0AAD9V8J1_ACRCE|nr:T-cell acute lymphocytic leukemia protein 1 [Acropora cervicornis]